MTEYDRKRGTHFFMQDFSKHYTYRDLLRYTFPTVIMLVVSSVYYVVDGFYVSNYTGKQAFAAVNFIWPVLMLLGGTGFMFGTGGSALIGKTMGEGRGEKADEIFSMILKSSLIVGGILGLLGFVFLRPIAVLMGAKGEMLELSLLYGRICMLGIPGMVLQNEFESLCVTAGKPRLGLYSAIGAGVTNIVLDALFIAAFHWDVAGAALASIMSQCIGGFVPYSYFKSSRNNSLLHLRRFRYDSRAMTRTCSNGISELLNNISMSLVGMLYNVQLLRYIGEDGVAAYGVLMYVSLVFIALFIGYSVGTAPIVSFQYGAQNHKELHSLFKKSLVVLTVSSLAMFLACQAMGGPLSRIFAGYDPELMAVTERGFFFYAFSFLFAGFGIWTSSFFTALNNGLLSAVLSTARTLVFQVAGVLLLPLLWQVDGIWLSLAVAEFLAAALGGLLIISNQQKYHY